MKTIVIMLAGGQGTRMNCGKNKILIPLCGKPVIQRSIEAFISFADEMIIVTRPEDKDEILSAVSPLKLSFPWRTVCGGITRQESVLNALRAVSAEENDVILIHDAARCLVDSPVIERVIQSVLLYGSGIPGIPVTSTCKICGPDSFVQNTPDRSSLYEIQTPQGFFAGLIIPAALKAAEEHFEGTDDASLLEHNHHPVRIVPGSSRNFKLTEPDDIVRARVMLQGEDNSMRIGMGYDVHRLVPDRKLILCGVDIPYQFGLLGHSDADVALHALMDAMLGACALGDIGQLFPDTDERYRGISSMELLRETNTVLSAAGFTLCNVDITIVAQQPKILPWIPQMVANISSLLCLPESSVSIKATTTEKLGFEGRREGISSFAVCSVVRKKS